TAFLEELPRDTLKEFLKLLSNEERSITLKLLGFPEYSVGRLMTTDYIAIKDDWSVSEVLNYVRKYGHYSETIEVVYIINNQGVLLDDIDLRTFLFAPPKEKVSTLNDHKFIALNAYEDQEAAIPLFQKYGRSALPVINNQGILLGIVTADDVLNLIREEDTEDMQKLAGLEALDMPYMQTPFLELMQKRGVWLIVLFFGEMLTTTAMSYYQNEIAKALVLTLFLPLIISSGGNSGSQASTLIIRALALKEISIRDWWRVMRREIFSGLFLGAILGIIGFFRIILWSHFTDIYGPFPGLVAFSVGLSLIGVVLWGTLAGSMLPLLLSFLKIDPATSSAPFVATLVDVTGVIIYFSIAYLVLQGTLL
ncbi:MAG TPA: magnesium transporter, partial [Parachlamydiaceae bacterium]|nr:magnesium transporter [Parachlamydiaceae bacterium]